MGTARSEASTDTINPAMHMRTVSVVHQQSREPEDAVLWLRPQRSTPAHGLGRQCDGCQSVKGVKPDSQTEIFAALRLTWRSFIRGDMAYIRCSAQIGLRRLLASTGAGIGLRVICGQRI